MTAVPMDDAPNRRVLTIDDNEAIHVDFRKILAPDTTGADALHTAEVALFGDAGPVPVRVVFELTTATQGAEGVALVANARAAKKPFAMAFVDMRMPPGWDGLETIEGIWRVDPDVEIVLCTAFSDYSWSETVRRLGSTDRLLVVKKPFDPVEVLQVANALTQKWQLRRRAEQTMAELDTRVRARTAELERARDDLLRLNDHLAVARDAAEAANRAKTMFLANISHELRTPMTAILGYAELAHEQLAAREDMAEERESLATILRNAQHLVAVIGDLLDISKLEAGRLTVEAIPCAPLEVLDAVVALLRRKATAKGVSLRVDVAPEVPPSIVGDPLRLRQILLNLIDNAIKFTPAGEVSIAVAYRAADAQLEFRVVDSGCGMTPDVLARLFRPFEQADATTTRIHGGTGLGLAISRQLTELLGGDLTVTSEPGRGSEFVARVAVGPAIAVDAPPQPAATDPARESVPQPQAVAGKRVLVVEDGPDNQRLILHLLRRAGIEASLAENGAECLQQLGDHPSAAFDLVLMDIQMPVMDGLTATARLRAMGHRLPVVALTASAMLTDQQACRAAGCDAFLSKPIDRRRLIDTIAQLIATGRP